MRPLSGVAGFVAIEEQLSGLHLACLRFLEFITEGLASGRGW